MPPSSRITALVNVWSALATKGAVQKKRPPGRRTRATSLKAAVVSFTCSSTSNEAMQSNDESAKDELATSSWRSPRSSVVPDSTSPRYSLPTKEGYRECSTRKMGVTCSVSQISALGSVNRPPNMVSDARIRQFSSQVAQVRRSRQLGSNCRGKVGAVGRYWPREAGSSSDRSRSLKNANWYNGCPEMISMRSRKIVVNASTAIFGLPSVSSCCPEPPR